MSLHTIKSIMERFECDREAAYGFIQFMKGKGLAVKTGTSHTPGARGKGQDVYQINDDATNIVTALMDNLK